MPTQKGPLHINSYREPRLTVYSVLLLVVFVGAVAFVLAAAVWQPWDSGGSPGEQVIVQETTIDDQTVAEEPASDGATLVDGGTDDPDAGVAREPEGE